MKLKRNLKIQKLKLNINLRQNRQFLVLSLLILLVSFSFNTINYSYAKNVTNKSDLFSEVLPQPLAPDLLEIKGTKTITPDWLVNNFLIDLDTATIRWFDNKNIIYSTPSTDGNPDRPFEMINIDTNAKRALGTGADPVASPDKKWIVFVQGKDEARQLWIMDSSGQNLKQMSHVENGLFPSNFFTKYIWSSDSKSIALLYKQNYNYEIRTELLRQVKLN